MFTVDFNPRSHERSDAEERGDNHFDAISIHAPTRGATNGLTPVWKWHGFQSTLPREERRKPLPKTVHSWKYFNPRSHERSDPPYMTQVREGGISIHAPTRGATLSI